LTATNPLNSLVSPRVSSMVSFVMRLSAGLCARVLVYRRLVARLSGSGLRLAMKFERPGALASRRGTLG
jgi:hypothetical protein